MCVDLVFFPIEDMQEKEKPKKPKEFDLNSEEEKIRNYLGGEIC